MLDYMRKNAQSVVIVFVLSILILAFIIEFGPQSRGCRNTDRQSQRSASAVMTVLGYEVTDLEFELWRAHIDLQPGLPLGGRYMPCYRTAAMLASLGPMFGGSAKGAPLDETEDSAHYRNAFLIREALVREAQRAGVAIDDEEIKSALARSRIFIFDHAAWTDNQGGVHYCGGELPLRVGIGRNGKFDPNALRAALQQQFQMSVDDFYAFERRNLLALKMQQLLAAGVGASPAEVEQAVRAEATAVDLQVWIVGPATGSDEEASALQTRFDELRAAVADSEIDIWLAQEANARKADERLAAANPPADGGFDPARSKREIARSLIAVERMAEDVRAAARAARIAFTRPEGAPAEPPPTAPGLLIRAHTEQLRPLAPASELPPSLRDHPQAVARVLALTEASPVLAEDIEQEATAASVKDPAGERYALHQVVLVRRTGPWDLEAVVRRALEEKKDSAAAAFLAVKRARMLEAWYASALFDARASDNIDDERLIEYLEALRQRAQ